MSKFKTKQVISSKFMPKKKSIAQRALSIAKKVDKKQKQQIEYAISDCNGLTAGTLNATRVVEHVNVSNSPTVTLSGSKAYLKSIRARFFVDAQSASPENYRFDVILDRNPIPGTIATTTEIYQSIATPLTMINKLNVQRFKVLRSFSGWVSTSTVGGYMHDAFIKLNLKIEAKDDGGDYSQSLQTKNAILVVYGTDATASQPLFKFNMRAVILDD